MADTEINTLPIPGKVPLLKINCKAFGKLFGNSARKVWTSSPVPAIVCACMKNEGGSGETLMSDELIKQGFSLCHPDDYVILLMHGGEQVAVFSQTGATKESIEAECEKHLSEEHGQ